MKFTFQLIKGGLCHPLNWKSNWFSFVSDTFHPFFLFLPQHVWILVLNVADTAVIVVVEEKKIENQHEDNLVGQDCVGDTVYLWDWKSKEVIKVLRHRMTLTTRDLERTLIVSLLAIWHWATYRTSLLFQYHSSSWSLITVSKEFVIVIHHQHSNLWFFK